MTTSHPLTVLIFSVNDVYQTKNFGRLTQFVKDTVAARNPDKHFVTMNGDFLSPSLLSSIDKGKTKIKLMNNVKSYKEISSFRCLIVYYCKGPIRLRWNWKSRI
jgi:hypothetical protein